MQREIMAIANSQNKSETYMSNAETFGELKAELIARGFKVEDMDIKEGKSRTDLRDELTPLPSNFNYKGQETSDLLILITPKNTKIKSGMATRQELYAKIKQYGLQGECVRRYGKNFTQCPSDGLANIVEAYETAHNAPQNPAQPASHVPASSAELKETIKSIVNEELDKREGEYSFSGLIRVFLKMINFFEGLKIGDYHLVNKATCDNWRKAIRKDYTPYTAEEIAEMSK